MRVCAITCGTPVLFGTPPLTLRLHLHGLFMTLWVVLFLVQARLIAIGRRRLHRALGVTGVVVGTLAMASTYAAAMETARLGAWGDPTATRLFSQVLVITLSSAFAGAGVYRKRPEIHKRLMLLATIAALGPVAVRAVRLIAGPGLPDPHIPVEAVMLMAALMYDWRTRPFTCGAALRRTTADRVADDAPARRRERGLGPDSGLADRVAPGGHRDGEGGPDRITPLQLTSALIVPICPAVIEAPPASRPTALDRTAVRGESWRPARDRSTAVGIAHSIP